MIIRTHYVEQANKCLGGEWTNTVDVRGNKDNLRLQRIKFQQFPNVFE